MPFLPLLLLRRPFFCRLFSFSMPPTKPYLSQTLTLTLTSPTSLSMSNGNGVYVPPMRRLRSVIEVPPSSNGSAIYRPPPRCHNSPAPAAVAPSSASTCQQQQHQQSAGYSRYAYDDWSEDDSDRERERDRSPASSSSSSKRDGASSENVEEWRWRLSMLLRNDREQEIVTRERKDRREFDHLSQLADRMGLHWASSLITAQLKASASCGVCRSVLCTIEASSCFPNSILDHMYTKLCPVCIF